MKNLFLAIVTGVLISCTVPKTVYTKNIFDPWVNTQANDLLKEWGSADGVSSDEAGGKILTYDRSLHVSNSKEDPGFYFGQFVVGNNKPRLYYNHGDGKTVDLINQIKIEFFVNAEGVIYAWNTTGIPASYLQEFKSKDIKSGEISKEIFSKPTK